MSAFNPEVPDDWQLNKSLLECSSQLFLSTHLSDVTFVFPEESRANVPAHKFILALRSPVFEAMFYSSWASSDTDVEIDDISSTAFKDLLRFVYTDKAELQTSHLIETMQAAHRYRIPLLCEICAETLETSVNNDNVCVILDQASLYDLKRLQTRCQKFIDENAADVFKSSSFRQLSVASIESILSSNNLCVEEYEAYQAAVVWAEAECSRQNVPPTGQNKRAVLGAAFYQLRIPHIPLQTFSSGISRDGVLTSDEVVEIFRRHTTEPQGKLDFVNCTKRNPTCLSITRMQEGLRRSNMSSNKGWRTETIKLRVSQHSRLVSLGLLNMIVRTECGDEFHANSHMTAVEIQDLCYSGSDSDSDDDFLAQLSAKDILVNKFCFPFTSDETDYIPLDLPSPVDLNADRWYRLEVTIYSFNKAVVRGKNFIQLNGSTVKNKVILPSGLSVVFQGSTHGPIHSIFLRSRRKAASTERGASSGIS